MLKVGSEKSIGNRVKMSADSRGEQEFFKARWRENVFPLL